MNPPSPGLVLFARTPIAGKVKTRLQPGCSAQQAAEVAAILVEETVRVVRTAWPGPVELCVWPEPHHDILHRISVNYDVPLTRQVTGTLGDKMQHAMTRVGYPCAVMGCDVPQCLPVTLVRASTLLTNGDNVIGPSTDGGYYLLGLQHPAPAIFTDIDWGEDSVLGETLRRAVKISLHLPLLEPLLDIDSFVDLVEVSYKVPTLARWLDNQGLRPHSHNQETSKP